MADPLVSVIIPVYNVEPYVREAIESVISQTYQRLEIIIVDDGSTDGSGAICDEYKNDSRIIVIHQDNKGLSGARNTGLDLMTGDIVAFLDSDDYYYPEMIEKMVREMTRCNADIVICDFLWDDRTCNLERRSYSSIEALKVLISGKMELANWNKIYKKQIWDDIRFPEGHIYEGTRTTYKLVAKATTIEQIPECLLFHRTRPGSIVKTRTKDNSEEYFLACEEFERYVIEHTPSVFSEPELNRFLRWRFPQKVPHWATIEKDDPVHANEIRKKVVRTIKSTKTWEKKIRVIYFLFKYYPKLLFAILKKRGQVV